MKTLHKQRTFIFVIVFQIIILVGRASPPVIHRQGRRRHRQFIFLEHYIILILSLLLPTTTIFAEAPSLEGQWAMGCQKIPSDVGIEESLTSQFTVTGDRFTFTKSWHSGLACNAPLRILERSGAFEVSPTPVKDKDGKESYALTLNAESASLTPYQSWHISILNQLSECGVSSWKEGAKTSALNCKVFGDFVSSEPLKEQLQASGTTLSLLLSRMTLTKQP